MSWLVAILGLALLVFVHELGHFSAARVLGIKPRALYVGFPPAIATVERDGIEYGIGAIPLGGYVRLPGMQRPSAADFEAMMSPAVGEDRALRPGADHVQQELAEGDFDAAAAAAPSLRAAVGGASLSRGARRAAEQAVREVEEGSAADAGWRQPAWKRALVIAAGPGMNVLVAFLIFFAVYLTGAPSQTPSTEVAEVQAGTPAAAIGLRAGDHIVAVDGVPARTFREVSRLIGSSDGRPVTVTVRRGGRTVTLGPRRTIEREGRWVLGFIPASQLVSHPLGASARLAARDCWQVVTGTLAAIGETFRSGSRAQISGPVGIVRASSEFLAIGVQWYLQLLGLISMSVALFNLLPLLPLDGGNLLFLLVEAVRGRPVPRAVYARFSSFGVALLLLVMVFALFHDVGVTAH